MKSSELKITNSHLPQLHKAGQPFFRKEGELSVSSEDTSQTDFFFSPKTIQTKLTVGQPGDKYEQEADAMADQVVQKLAAGGPRSTVQRMCADCGQEEEGIAPKLQRKAIFESNEEPVQQKVQRKCETCDLQASSDLESRLNASRGGGSPLTDETRTSMESTFGTDFSGVRVHTNSGAVQMNQELGAQAFTHGSDVYFNSGKYSPGSTEGQRLLGHELTHVVQQGIGKVKETMQADGMSVINDVVLEKEADDVGRKVKVTMSEAGVTQETPTTIQKMGHEKGCGCSVCKGNISTPDKAETEPASTIQKKIHDNGCGCASCSKRENQIKGNVKADRLLQRKQATSPAIQLRPANVVNHTFLGVSVAGGVERGMSARLDLVQAELQRQYNALPAVGKPASLQDYAGLSTITGWQNRTGNHGTGRAVDVNYLNQPYIATRTTEGGRTTYGGEQGSATAATRALRRPAVEVYDRAVSFMLIMGASSDVSNRRTGESATDVYRRFRLTSDSLANYLSLAFNTNYDEVTRPPILNPETASDAALLAIPTTERKDEATAIADITTFMSGFIWQLLHPGYPLTPREQYFRILRDYEIVRKPMQRGNPATQPGNTRNPTLGFLHMPEHFVVAMMEQGNLRWGACEFSARSNGDMHHFDMTPAHHSPSPAPAPAAVAGATPIQEKAIVQKRDDFGSIAQARLIHLKKKEAENGDVMESRLHVPKSAALFGKTMLQMSPAEDEPGDTTYSKGEFEISELAILRAKDANWNPIKYKSGDPDLPTKTVDGKLTPDESFVGKNKSIEKGAKVNIDDMHIVKASNKTSNDKLEYVHIVGHGWTKVSNIKGGLKNFSVGTMEAVKPLSMEADHYTVAVKNAVILKSGNRYVEYKDKRVIPENTVVNIDETFKGYYADNTSRDLAKVSYDGKTTFTAKGNYTATAHNKKEPTNRKVVGKTAFERQEIPSYIPDSGTMPLGKHVIIGNSVAKATGTYVEVFEVISTPDPDGKIAYAKGASLGWTNMLNLTHGFHTDLKGLNAMWDQVVPDERYDRPKGKDTQGTAKFTGNEDMIKIVDSQGEIEHVSKEIWPSLNNMLSDANAAGQALQLNTGFRDWDYQQAMISGGFQANPVGFSAHQRGIAVDLNNKNSTQTGGINWWMERNAYKYGFVRTYKKFVEGHHWEYRPNEVVEPEEIEKGGKKYLKYKFATFGSTSNAVWDRNHVLDEIPPAEKNKEK